MDDGFALYGFLGREGSAFRKTYLGTILLGINYVYEHLLKLKREREANHKTQNEWYSLPTSSIFTNLLQPHFALMPRPGSNLTFYPQ